MKLKNKLMIFFIILLIVLGLFIYRCLAKDNKYDITFEEITTREYFLIFDDKYGVIDKNGEVIVETKFDMVQLPNPSKDIFVCMSNYNSQTGSYETKVYNKNKEELFNEYENVEAIRREENLSNIPYEKNVLKYKVNGKYGLLDFEGKKITKPIYEDIQALEFKEGMLLVKKDNKFGVINIAGEKIINNKYDFIEADSYTLNQNYNEKVGYNVAIKERRRL